MSFRHYLIGALLLCAAVPLVAQDKPNILVVWGDDVGVMNISAYHRGLLGGTTPNIDSIAAEGALFTDAYAQQSCTAGRASFVLGQHPFRTGLLTIGMPGAEQGIMDKDPTIAELLKNHGYMSGQFGKNHLGDRDEHLPTRHGFDEFFGNLYHLNAEEEPEEYDYPTEEEFPGFHEKFGPRGVIHSWAGGDIIDTGPLTKKRMETIDDEVSVEALRFIDEAAGADEPHEMETGTWIGGLLDRRQRVGTAHVGNEIQPVGLIHLRMLNAFELFWAFTYPAGSS